MKRSELKRKTPLKKTRIKPVSEKQKVEIALRQQMKMEHIADFGYECMLCFRKTYELDLIHLVRLSAGGKTTRENTRTACRECHDTWDGRA